MLSLSADIIEKFYTFLWPLTRIGAVIMTAPLFATESANARLRLMLTLVVTWFIPCSIGPGLIRYRRPG